MVWIAPPCGGDAAILVVVRAAVLGLGEAHPARGEAHLRLLDGVGRDPLEAQVEGLLEDGQALALVAVMDAVGRRARPGAWKRARLLPVGGEAIEASSLILLDLDRPDGSAFSPSVLLQDLLELGEHLLSGSACPFIAWCHQLGRREDADGSESCDECGPRGRRGKRRCERRCHAVPRVADENRCGRWRRAGPAPRAAYHTSTSRPCSRARQGSRGGRRILRTRKRRERSRRSVRACRRWDAAGGKR